MSDPLYGDDMRDYKVVCPRCKGDGEFHLVGEPRVIPCGLCLGAREVQPGLAVRYKTILRQLCPAPPTAKTEEMS